MVTHGCYLTHVNIFSLAGNNVARIYNATLHQVCRGLHGQAAGPTWCHSQHQAAQGCHGRGQLRHCSGIDHLYLVFVHLQFCFLFVL